MRPLRKLIVLARGALLLLHGCVAAAPLALRDNASLANTEYLLQADVTSAVVPPDSHTVLTAAGSSRCPRACATYKAGAHKQMPFVAMVLSDGIPMDSVQFACYPPYNALEDWLICFQGNSTTDDKIPKYTHKEICGELDDLPAAPLTPSSGMHKSRSTSATPKGGWMKVFGDIGCGWGSTYWNVKPGDNAGMRKTVPNVNSAKDCCLQAMALEGSDVEREGGAAVRFQLKGTTCHIDREIMVRSNLDGSSGRSLQDQDMCSHGHTGSVVSCDSSNSCTLVDPGAAGDLYWRHAAGGAEASNLRSPGVCALKNKFKRFEGSKASANIPAGGMYGGNFGQSNEFPNHGCMANGGTEDACKGSIRYNPIGDVEECCDACASLQWVNELGGDSTGDIHSGTTADPSTGLHVNPCVAFQIHEGKCIIYRQKVFTEYSLPGVDRLVLPIERALSQQSDHWDCVPDGKDQRGCNYYSHIYFRNTPATNKIVGTADGYEADNPEGAEANITTAAPEFSIPSGTVDCVQTYFNLSTAQNSSSPPLSRRLLDEGAAVRFPGGMSKRLLDGLNRRGHRLRERLLEARRARRLAEAAHSDDADDSSDLRFLADGTIHAADALLLTVQVNQIPTQGPAKLQLLQSLGEEANWTSYTQEHTEDLGGTSNAAGDEILPQISVYGASAFNSYSDGSQRLDTAAVESACDLTFTSGLRSDNGTLDFPELTVSCNISDICGVSRRRLWAAELELEQCLIDDEDGLLQSDSMEGEFVDLVLNHPCHRRFARRLSQERSEIVVSFGTLGSSKNRMSYDVRSVRMGADGVERAAQGLTEGLTEAVQRTTLGPTEARIVASGGRVQTYTLSLLLSLVGLSLLSGA